VKAIPLWVRPAVSGEVFDDLKERRCISKKCGAVLRRQEGESEAAWASKRYCSGQCYGGYPPIRKPG
jgi:hypothetical protein